MCPGSENCISSIFTEVLLVTDDIITAFNMFFDQFWPMNACASYTVHKQNIFLHVDACYDTG